MSRKKELLQRLEMIGFPELVTAIQDGNISQADAERQLRESEQMIDTLADRITYSNAQLILAKYYSNDNEQ